MRGVVLSILTVGAGYLVYAVGDTGGASQFSSDDPAFAPPVVHAATAPPRVIHDTSDPVVTEAPRDRASLARDLQRALARAGCYEGPINGKWTATTKDAMGAFLLAANAQLPLDTPDQTLLALATSNAHVECAPKPPPYAAAMEAHAVPPAPAAAAPAAPSEAPKPAIAAGDQTPVERQWAPPEMLLPPKEAAAPPPPKVTLAAEEKEGPISGPPMTETRVSVATTAGVVSDAPISPIPAAAPASSVIHFENGEPVAETDPSFAKKDPPPKPPKVAQRPSKSRKRPPSDYDQISSSLSKSWKSMQRSLSAMFD